MSKRLTLLVASLFVSVSALAAETPDLYKGDASAGEAKSQSCAACHGADGNSAAPNFPKLAGQNARYLIKQMKDIRSGLRSVPAMAGQLDGKSDEDLADIAAYFASQQTTIGQADPELVKQGEAIYRAGIAARGVPACTGCHSPTGSGNAAAGYPRLSGQHAQYIEAQLKSFQSAADGDPQGRHNDGDDKKTMRTIAFPLSDNEIKAVASYIEGLH